jgi:hypothetical protein
MPTVQIQEEILKTLSGAETALAMSELVERVRMNTSQPANSIRSAVLPLISLQQVELTDDRKLQLAK